MNLTQGALRLTAGIEEIEEWAQTADDQDRADVYDLLFTVAGSVMLRAYPVLGDDDSSISVLVRPDLAVCLIFPEPGTFGVLTIGDPTPGVDPR